MVSLSEIRNRLQSAFTADQAALIASLHVEMHDQLVTRHDFAELRGIVERLAGSQQDLAEAQNRTERSVADLAQAQQRTELRLDELAQAQHRTELRLNDLAQAQVRTELRLDDLAQAQVRTELRLDDLAQAQVRTERQIEGLTEAQQRTEHVVAGLVTAVARLEFSMKDLAKQVGGLAATAGGNLEAYAGERIPEVLAERFGFVMESCGSEAVEAGGKCYDFDAVLRGTIDGRAVIVVCEVKTNISESEVRGFLRIVERVRPALEAQVPGAEVRPLFFGYRAAVVTQKLAAGSGAWLVFPRGLVAAA